STLKKWNDEFRDCVYLSFAIEHKEIERLLPPGTKADTRHYRGKEWGFFSLIFLKSESTFSQLLPWPKFKYSLSILRFYVIDGSNRTATYLARFYSPGFQSTLLKLIGGVPVARVNADFPTRAQPGGIFSWNIEGRGAVDIRCKIEARTGLSGGLPDLFEEPDDYRRFILNRPIAYHSASLKDVKKIKLSAHYSKPHQVTIKKCELGLIAADMERHSFPEAISGAFYLSDLTVGAKVRETVPLAELTG
ncbi:MAG: hypothetical protein ACLFN5_07825, partial [bacterium]